MSRIHLSPPDVGPTERSLLLDAFDSNWIAPLGPHVDAFERELASYVGVRGATALSSGTAALHLALHASGIGPGDDVLVPSLTFAATVNAVCYTGARPVLLDSERESWNVDPDLVAEAATKGRATGRAPKALLAVDLYGQCADYARLETICEAFDLVLIEDAAEALGASRDGRAAGSFGHCAAFSFNGNKIITTSGGGMLVSADDALTARVHHLATQAREPVPHYEHAEVGFNYRLSNLLAAIGRGQLQHLDERMAKRRAVHERYRDALADLPGVAFAPVAPRSAPNAWLTVITIDPEHAACTPTSLIDRLAADDIEARPAWKPMHRQPAFAEAPVLGGSVADEVFARGVCLPSGSALTETDISRVVDQVRASVLGRR